MCYVLLVWWGWFAEGVFAASGPVTTKKQYWWQNCFFPVYCAWAVCVCAACERWTVLDFGFLSWKAGGSAAPPFLLEDLTQGLGKKLGWQRYCCVRTKQGAQWVSWANGSPRGWDYLVLNEMTNMQTKSGCSACHLLLAHLKGLCCAMAGLRTVRHIHVWPCL